MTLYLRCLVIFPRISVSHAYDIGPNGLRVTSKDKAQTLTENLGETDIIRGS